MQRFTSFLAGIPGTLARWSPARPPLLLTLGFGALVAAWVAQPGPDEWTYVLGWQLGGECSFQQAFGHPCASCGMTRSWTWLARGRVWRALVYNPAGALMLAGLVAAALLAALRIATGDPRRLRIRPRWLTALVLGWIAVYYVHWAARIAGWNPLP